MIFITSFLLVSMIRFMIGMIINSMWHIFYLNHIHLPEPGWKLELLNSVITIMVVSPILATIMMAQ